MHLRLVSLVISVSLASLLHAAAPAGPARVTVAALTQALAEASGESDAALATRLAGLELSERMNPQLRDQLAAKLPGERSRLQLTILTSQSAFLPPKADEVVADPTPTSAETRQMLVKVVGYVNTTVRQLPNFLATRGVAGFEDTPPEDRLEATGIVSISPQPMHLVGRLSEEITYRDHRETVEKKSDKSAKGKVGGLLTYGEFGPILSTVVGDALKGKIEWARWQHGPAATEAVFHFEVPAAKSSYHVRYCCVIAGYGGSAQGSGGQAELEPFDEQAAYHGEIVFNPADGSILRILVQAEMQPGELVSGAGMVVEYGPVEIGGKAFICPLRAVSILQAHVAQQGNTQSRSSYKGPVKTYLNETAFGSYRRFGTELRLLPGEPNP